jgi:two-component system, NarL family, response regulator LiaR
MMTIRVLIVDDHAVVRQGLRSLLENQPHIVVAGEAADGTTAVALAQELAPDVVLMDLLMPGMSGLEAIRRIHEMGSPARILVLTSSVEDQLVKQALQAGAQGYVLKAIRVADLVAAIERVAQGLRALDPAATEVLMHHVQEQDPFDLLTTREREVFEGLARGWTNGEIADRLSVSEATVRTHISNILDKLALRDRTQVMIYALKRGLVRLEDLA